MKRPFAGERLGGGRMLAALRLLGLLFIMIAGLGECESNIDTNDKKPVINVFYEPIAPEQRFTSMTEDDDAALLAFWKQEWTNAGWEPRVLTLQDAKRHALYETFDKDLIDLCIDEFGKLSLLRWLAMAASGGGWLADYDAFPVRDFRNDGIEMPHNGEMTIYEMVAPVLVSGKPDAWLETAKFLLGDAKINGRTRSRGSLSFWTDTLGLLSAWRHPNCTLHVKKEVLDVRKAITEKALTSEDCAKRPFRGKRVVHVGHFAILEARIRPELRLPQHRLTVAKEMLPVWISVCGNANINNATTTATMAALV